LELLDDIRKRYNLAMLFITHDLRVAAQICDRLIVMKSGKIVEQGATAQVYASPQDSYTRLLLDAAPGANVEFGQGSAVG
jgi:peptide/nickel transport system ATP-binding protein